MFTILVYILLWLKKICLEEMVLVLYKSNTLSPLGVSRHDRYWICFLPYSFVSQL